MYKVFISCILLSIAFMAAAQEHFSIHEAQKDYYDSFGLTTNQQYDSLNGFKLMPDQKSRAGCSLNRVVFGWHPYWVGSTYLNYRWDLLSDLSFFSYEVDASTGNAVTTHGWETAAIVDSALNNGTRVNLCVTLFSGHATFFASSTAQQTLITNLINLVNLRGANGVNIDFEGVPSSESAHLTAFMINLCNQMHTAIPGSQISICLYSVDWSNLFDVVAMDPYIDYYTIMGYGYYYSGSATAGPTAQLYTMSSFDYNLSKTITYYLDKGASKEKLVMGLPYYGHEWNTTSSTVPSSTTSSVGSRTYKYVKDNASGNYSTRLWEPNSFNPYYVYNVGNWRQCFVDDEISLGYKYDLINRRDIAGIAIWALGYDDGYTELWDMIRDKFTDCAIVPCSDTLYDMGGPAHDHYDNEYYWYTIAPDNATGLNMNFTSFFLESGYDSLWIYDGYDLNAPLIGGYSGTSGPGMVTASGGALTLEFYSDNATNESGWMAVWQCAVDNIDPVTTISAGNWETTDFTANFSDTDNDAVDMKFYQVLDNDGSEWRANGDYGFLNDNFESAVNPEWTLIDGTWNISSNHLNQTDEVSSNTNLFIDVAQDSGYIYMYHWQMSIGGSGTNRRAGLHFFCDSAGQTNRNNSYMVYFRVDQDKCQLYRYDDDVMGLKTDDNCQVDPDTWYDYKVIFNTVTGEITAFQNDIPVSSWIDAVPYKHGNSISLRTGNCNVMFDDVKVYRSRSTGELITVGNPAAEVRYQNSTPSSPACRIKSVITDAAGNFSLPGSLNVNIDWTPPADIAYVNDGASADVDTTTSSNQLSANWAASGDPHSDIMYYLYAIGTTAGDSDVVVWTACGQNTNVSHTGLILSPGQQYYFTVMARNGAGLYGNPSFSDGILADSPTVPPVAGFTPASLTVCTGNTIHFYNDSQNGSDYFWEFEGGLPATSILENPTILYNTPGIYGVTLVVTNTYGTDTLVTDSLIAVHESPEAVFSATPLSGPPPLIVMFSNNSTGAGSYYWDFGDGGTSSDTNPYHIYNNQGYHDVMLIAYSSMCPEDILFIEDYIYVEDPNGLEYLLQPGSGFYPNPAGDMVFFGRFAHYTLYSADGKIIMQGSGTTADLKQLAAGIYLLGLDEKKYRLVKE